MNDIIASFPPVETGLNRQTIKYLVFTIVILWGVVGLYFYKVKESRNKAYRQMLLMLGTFGVLIFAGSTFFSHWTTIKLTPVVFNQTSMETPYGKVNYDDIHNAYFHDDKIYGKIARDRVTQSTRFLVIREISKKEHPLSGEYYDINKIYETLKQVTKKN